MDLDFDVIEEEDAVKRKSKRSPLMTKRRIETRHEKKKKKSAAKVVKTCKASSSCPLVLQLILWHKPEPPSAGAALEPTSAGWRPP